SVKGGALATVAEAFSFGSPSGVRAVLMDEVAVYSSALTPGRIDSHWSHGEALRTACPAAPTGAYPESVLHDAPALYLRLDEGDRLVRDYSGHCADGSTNAGADGNVAFEKPAATADGDKAVELKPGSIVLQAGTT